MSTATNATTMLRVFANVPVLEEEGRNFREWKSSMRTSMNQAGCAAVVLLQHKPAQIPCPGNPEYTTLLANYNAEMVCENLAKIVILNSLKGKTYIRAAQEKSAKSLWHHVIEVFARKTSVVKADLRGELALIKCQENNVPAYIDSFTKLIGSMRTFDIDISKDIYLARFIRGLPRNMQGWAAAMANEDLEGDGAAVVLKIDHIVSKVRGEHQRLVKESMVTVTDGNPEHRAFECEGTPPVGTTAAHAASVDVVTGEDNVAFFTRYGGERGSDDEQNTDDGRFTSAAEDIESDMESIHSGDSLPHLEERDEDGNIVADFGHGPVLLTDDFAAFVNHRAWEPFAHMDIGTLVEDYRTVSEQTNSGKPIQIPNIAQGAILALINDSNDHIDRYNFETPSHHREASSNPRPIVLQSN